MAAGEVAPALWGIPVVSGSSERAALFPVPATDQRVFNKAASAIERWTGSAWVSDFAGSGNGLVINIAAAPYNCDPTGVLDATAGMRAAVSAYIAATVSSSFGAGAGSGSPPRLFAPAGKYKITGDIANGQQINYLLMEGERAIFEVTAGVTWLSGVRYMVNLKGITVRGGAIAVAVATGNVDTALITTENCEFHQQTSRCFDIDSNSSSTFFYSFNSKFVLNAQASAQIIKTLSCDYVVFEKCWFNVMTSADAAFDITNGTLYLEDCIGVPSGTTPPIFAWVELNGTSSFYADKCRFGGEGGGASDSIVVNRVSADTSYPVTPTRICMRDCQTYVTGALLHLYAIPNEIDCTGLTGLVDTLPIKVDSGVSAADIAAIGNGNTIFRLEYNSKLYDQYISPVSAPASVREGLPRVMDREMPSTLPNLSDLALQTQAQTGAFGPAIVTTNVTASDVTDELGVPGKNFLATADNGSATLNYSTMLNGLAAGLYTAVFDVDVTTDTSVRPLFKASNVAASMILPRGRHSVCIPFYYDGGSVKNVGFELYTLPNTANVFWRRVRIYKGRRFLAGNRAEFSDTAAPSSGQFYRGDRVWRNNKSAVSSPSFHECLVSGTPGTWSASPISGTYTPTLVNVSNTDARTAYACQYTRVGDVVTVSGQVDIDPTAAAGTLTRIRISLPIASNLSAITQLAGVASDGDQNTGSAQIYADTTNHDAVLGFNAKGTANTTFMFTFTYSVV